MTLCHILLLQKSIYIYRERERVGRERKRERVSQKFFSIRVPANLLLVYPLNVLHNNYRRWFPMILSDNYLKVAGSILTAAE